jgi:flagellar biosynthesis/type III secretory pathway protein FliH
MSRERLTIPAGVVAFRAAPAAGAPSQKNVESPAAAGGLTALELKDLQRRAFERGVETARAEAAEAFGGLLDALRGAVDDLFAARKIEREAMQGFAVELAIGLAEEMTGAALRDGRHDLRALVESAAAEALPFVDDAATTAYLSPDDLSAVEQLVALRPLSIGRDATFRADPSLPRGACRVVCGGAQVTCDPSERLKTAAKRLRDLAARKLAEGAGHDAL